MKRLILALLVVFVVAAGCGDDEGNVFSLEEGQCFDDPQATGEISDVPIVECDEPHDNEVFFTFDLPDGDYPGDIAVQEQASEGCLGAFEGYVGLDYATSELDILFLSPTSDSWDQADDREVVCFLYRVDQEKMTGSMQGSGI